MSACRIYEMQIGDADGVANVLGLAVYVSKILPWRQWLRGAGDHRAVFATSCESIIILKLKKKEESGSQQKNASTL